ncbi:MAG: hypothetical protein R3E13_11855 [Alphaproteobacteria bacterium]
MQETSLSTDKVLRCFFSECERHFRFLEERHGYSFLCGMAEYKNNYKIIKPLEDRPEEGRSFSAVTRYEKDGRAIEICFGNELFMVEAYSFYNPFERFELAEILTAARKDSQCLAGDKGVSTPELIQKTLGRIATCLEKHARVILNPGPKLLERAMTIRSARLEQGLRQKHSDALQAICADAASAYLEKNYRRVVELLEPHKAYLQKADLKKLERAKKYLLSHSS